MPALRCAFWDHWVPTGNDAMRQLCGQWGERNRVNVQLDFINTTGNQLQLTAAAQAQSRSGHDIISLAPWDVGSYADQLEPVDDVMARLSAKYGPPNAAAEFLAKQRGSWRAVPATSGTQNKPACVRFDLMQEHAGLDVRAMWPAENRKGPGADNWTWETFLTAAEACHKGRLPLRAFPWASSPMRWTGWARCSPPTAPASRMSAACPRSATTRSCAPRSSTACACRASCRTTSGPGTTPRTTAR
jgi:ABC-type glycerol-3-phosphate transport system substrate-binding protein